MRNLLPLILLLALRAEAYQFINLNSTPVQEFNCSEKLRGPRPTRLGNERQVVITEWNVENVMERTGKFEQSAPVDGKYHYQKVEDAEDISAWKFPAKQTKLANIGNYLNLPGNTLSHFLIAPEVESLKAAEQLLNQGILKDKYDVHLVTGNDERGINIAMAVRSDLDVRVDFETHRDVKWYDPIERAQALLFSRDISVMIVRDAETDEVQLILMGTHYKSMRDRAGGADRRSTVMRSAQIEATAQIVKNYQTRFGADVPIVLAGDFNTDLRNTSEIAPLKSELLDSFDVLKLKNRTTQTYHPNPSTIVQSQLDGIFISPSMRPYLVSAAILPEFDQWTGQRLGLPRSYEDRSENYPSDHRAISIVLNGRLFRH